MTERARQQENGPTGPVETQSNDAPTTRRGFLGKAAVGAGMVGSMLMFVDPAIADSSRGRPSDPDDRGRGHDNDDDDQGTPGVWQPLPPDTPVASVLTPDLLQLLTPAAAQATTTDLLSIGNCGQQTQAALSLNVRDLQSLQSVFTPLLLGLRAGGGGGGGGCCCCCAPCSCCCCTPVVSSVIG